MKTIDQILQASYRDSDQQTVTLTLKVPLGLLRQEHELFKQLNAKIAQQDAAPKPKPSPAPKPHPKNRTKPTGRAGRKGAKVTLATVSKAIAEGHTSPAAIAKLLGASSKAVSNALGRYVKQGALLRKQPGHYGLLTESAASSE